MVGQDRNKDSVQRTSTLPKPNVKFKEEEDSGVDRTYGSKFRRKLRQLSIVTDNNMVQRKIGLSTLYKKQEDYTVPLQFAVQKSEDSDNADYYIKKTEEA